MVSLLIVYLLSVEVFQGASHILPTAELYFHQVDELRLFAKFAPESFGSFKILSRMRLYWAIYKDCLSVHPIDTDLTPT